MKAARGCANVFQSEHGEESLVAAVAGICRRVATTAVQTARHLHSRGVWRIRPRDPRGGADDAHHRRIRRGMNGASSIHTNIFRLTLRRNVLVDEQKRRAHVETREVEKMSRKRWFESSDGTVSARRTGIRMHSSRHEPGTHSGCRRSRGPAALGARQQVMPARGLPCGQQRTGQASIPPKPGARRARPVIAKEYHVECYLR